MEDYPGVKTPPPGGYKVFVELYSYEIQTKVVGEVLRALTLNEHSLQS